MNEKLILRTKYSLTFRSKKKKKFFHLKKKKRTKYSKQAHEMGQVNHLILNKKKSNVKTNLTFYIMYKTY